MISETEGIYGLLQEITWQFGSRGTDGACCGDLSFVEFMALKTIDATKDCSIQQIGKRLNFTKSGATRIVNRLETKGYVVRKSSHADGRICCVSLTGQGESLYRSITRNYIQHLDQTIGQLKPDMVQKIRLYMELLLNAVMADRPESERSDEYAG